MNIDKETNVLYFVKMSSVADVLKFILKYWKGIKLDYASWL